jgi:hypothetical protein
MRLGTWLLITGLATVSVQAQQPAAGGRGAAGAPGAAVARGGGGGRPPAHNGGQGPRVQQQAGPLPSATGNYYTGAIPQPGYSIGVTPGATRNIVTSQGKGSGRGGRGAGFVGIPVFGGAYFPGYTDFSSPSISTFPGYASSGPIPPPPDLGPNPVGNPGPDPGTDALMQAQSAMADQIRQLSAQLADLRMGQPNTPAPQVAPSAPESDTSNAPIQVVLRNGQHYTVKSFAVMNGELWDFSNQRVRKIPVQNIDVAASSKATEDGGGQFPTLRN